MRSGAAATQSLAADHPAGASSDTAIPANATRKNQLEITKTARDPRFVTAACDRNHHFDF